MVPEGAAPYREAKRAGRDAVAEGLLALADARLAAEGPGGLSMRRLANAAGCSTMVFYTAFGTKAGLIEALAAREVDRWIDGALTHADPDPVAWLDATGRALLALAAERPHHRDLVLAPPAVAALGAAVRAAVADAWAAAVPDTPGADVAAAVWSAWWGALATVGGAGGAGEAGVDDAGTSATDADDTDDTDDANGADGAGDAARVHDGVLRLWSAALGRTAARSGGGVVP